jgi:hypothetical protein
MAAESNGSCSTAEAPLDAEVDLVDGAAEEDVGSLVELPDAVELVLEEDTGSCVGREFSEMNLRKSIQTISACLLFIGFGREQVCGRTVLQAGAEVGLECCVGADTSGIVPAKASGGKGQRANPINLDNAQGCTDARSQSGVDAALAALIKALSRHPSDCDYQSKEDANTVGEHHGLTGRVRDQSCSRWGDGGLIYSTSG